MKTTLYFAALLLCQLVAAQEGFRQVLQADPYLANGYFIVDSAKFHQLGLNKLKVEVIATRSLPGGEWGRPAGPWTDGMTGAPPLPLIEVVHGLGHAQQPEL
jgi:hypothetical protein